ncbi:hypothetical protein D9M71_415140 [compost metagenome]
MARQPTFVRLGQGIGQFAVDIQLVLHRRRVADAHRRRVLVTGEPGQAVLGEPALATQAIHDLHLFRVARHRAQQPGTPGAGFVVIAQVHERQQGHGRIT